MTFYGTMILEGLIAMIWAAAAMGLYNSGSTAGATAAVGEVAKGLLSDRLEESSQSWELSYFRSLQEIQHFVPAV